MNDHYQHHVFFYVMPRQKKNIILGLAGMEVKRIRLDAGRDILEIENMKTIVQEKNQKTSILQILYPQELFDVHMTTEIRRARKKSNSDMKIFAASMKDIEKALKKKRKTDL